MKELLNKIQSADFQFSWKIGTHQKKIIVSLETKG
jgi:hypothetical protein